MPESYELRNRSRRSALHGEATSAHPGPVGPGGAHPPMSLTTEANDPIYLPESSFGWLDFDSAASQRVATLMRALEEPGTLDPIGLGAVRDAFSEMLAPGTSTIQTRLRYFIFLPWICQRIQQDGVAPARFVARLRDDEARLIDCLRHLGPNQGVQGFAVGRDLQRMPSEAYWGGLWSWGLRTLDLSIPEYGRRIAMLGPRSRVRDDDGNATGRGASMWAPMVDAPPEFLAEPVSFDLTGEEAALLIDHIRRRHPGSLLAEACSFAAEAATADLPWDIAPSRFSPGLAEILRHARCVSELTLGPQHLYNLLLARRATAEVGWDTSGLQEAIVAQLETWASLVERRHAELRAWVDDLDGFWALVARVDRVSDPAKDFVNRMVTRAVEHPERFVEDQVVHGAIRDRERALKTKRARLTHRSALEHWNQQRFGAQLSYRWVIARSYLRDLGAAVGPGV